MFSSKHFIVSDLTFRSLIPFEFIFVYGVRECSNFIVLHVAVQFSQHHLLKRLSFLHCIFFRHLSFKAKLSLSVLVHCIFFRHLSFKVTWEPCLGSPELQEPPSSCVPGL